MATDALDVLRLLQARRYRCPLCSEQRWQAIADAAVVRMAQGGDRLLLTAVCRNCGYVVAVQHDVPERYENDD